MGGIENNPGQIIKLNNKKGENIDLNAFNGKGIEKNDINKSIFEKFDFNKDGKLDENECKSLQAFLKNRAGDDNILSKREVKSAGLFGKNKQDVKNFYSALNDMYSQQVTANNAPAAETVAETPVSEEEISPVEEQSTDVVETPETPEQEEVPEPQDTSHKYKVNYQDTWYGIVQAKYGITDHKQTMEIVRQLKAQNNVDSKATNMPAEITLPNNLQLKDGTEIKLANIDAEVDKSHWGYKTQSETGRYTVTQNGKTKYYAADGTELKQSYYEAKEASADKRNMSENGSGRYSYTAENGETWYFAADGTPIKKEYYEQRETEYTAVNAQKETVKNARAAFQQQLDSDGWAGKTADAVSVLWNSDNRAVKVDEDLKIYENQVKELQQAQSKGAAKFSAKFKEIYGVDYNPANIAAYEANPTDENYKKAYGTKNDIHKRVMDYNASQQQGAAVVKTTVEVGGAIALGAATIATGGIAGGIAVAAGATFVADVAVETTDRMSSANGLQDGELGQIAQNAVTDAVIAGTTLGAGKALGAGYKMYKGMKVVTAATGTTASTAARAVNKAVLSKTEGAVLDAVADTAVGAGAEYVETGHITAEGTLTNMAIGAGGLVIGKFGNKLRNVDNKFPTSADAPASQAGKNALDEATSGGTHTSGGRLGQEKYNNLLHDIQGELPNATPQRGAQLHYEADLHQNQSRAQGREIKHVVESEYNVTTRNKKHTGDSTQRSEQFVEQINKQAEQSAEHILSGNQGVLAPHDAAILDEHLVNNLNTIEDIEGFITKLKNRVGVDNNGKMFVQQVQGVDHAAKVLENAETKLTKLRNQLADFKAAGSAADSAVGAARGLNEQELAAISSYVDKAVSYDDLQALVDKFAQNKCLRNSSAARNLYKKMQDKALNLQLKQQSVAANAQSATRTNEPAPIAGETSNNVSGNDADFAAVQQQMIREGKLNPDGTPISGEQIKIASKQALTPSENKAIKFDEIRMSNRTPNGKANPGKTMGELLTPQQKKVYSDSMNAFERSKNRKITHNASNVLTTDNLLHGTNIKILLSNGGILDNGLIPREITGNCSAHFTNGVVPDTLTPLCSDVWDIRQNATIKDYFDANNSHWNNDGESRFLPNSDTKAASVVVVLNKNSIDPTLIDNSFEVNDSGRSVLFENGNMTRGHNYPTHRAIPIGAPANSIDRIIVDTRSLGQTQINELHKKIESLGLDIKLYDLNGKSI